MFRPHLNPPFATGEAAPRPGCLAYGLFAAAIIWACVVIGLSAPAAWLARDVLTIGGGEWPSYVELLVALGQALAVGLPASLLALLTQAPRLRAAYLTWALACGCLAVYGAARALPESWTQAAGLLSALCGLLMALGLRRAARETSLSGSQRWRLLGLGPGLLLGGLAAAPWLSLGALGSPLDSVLGLLGGASVGLLLGALLGFRLLPALAVAPGGAAGDIGFGGVVAGVTLLLLAAGAGFGASNLLLLAALPPLGIAVAALAWLAGGGERTWLAPAGLVGVAAAAALALFDPDEITIILGAHDIPELVLWASGWACLLGLLISAVLWAATTLSAKGSLLAALDAHSWQGAAATWGLALLLYAALGHPGFYGEKLFVIMRGQADLTKIAPAGDLATRRGLVYHALTSHAAASQADLRATLGRLGVRSTPYYLVNAMEVDGGPLLRAYLLSRPDVDRVLESPRLRPLPAPPPAEPGDAPAPEGAGWNVRAIGADRVWAELGVTGEGVVIGQSDSGVDGGHPALAAGFRGGAGSWLDPWYGAPTPRDYGMHGTHTLGTAAGRGGVGVAPGASWIACVNLARNLGNPAHYLDCMQFMLAPYPAGGDPLADGEPARGADVLNNSWGCPPIEGCDAASLGPAVAALRAAGIFVVASAGNEGAACGSVSDPIAIYADAFSVGAVDEAGVIAPFSSRGPVTVDGSGRSKPDVVAPGVGVVSAAPGGGYASADGTSMAGPHVAGVVALMWSANPRLRGDVARTAAILRETATPHAGDAGPACAAAEPGDNVYGAGQVDAYAAVRAALAVR